jgi:isopentenyldiphosphate isomerase
MSLLEVVNEADEVIGLKPRAEIHAQGLLHREIYIWIILGNDDVLLQRRGPTKDMFPNCWDCSVGGHVEIGQSYLETAVRELTEETGLSCLETDLISLGKYCFAEPDGDKNNHAFREFYLYKWQGDLSQLMVEKDEGAGFMAMPLRELLVLNDEEKKEFKTCFFYPEFQPIWRAIEAHLCAA